LRIKEHLSIDYLLLKELFMPLNVQVASNYPVSKGPAELDVIISSG
jgi:hypothetical protein